MDISTGGKTKYQRYERQGRKRIDLVCIKDGAEMQFWDDGPFPVGADGRPVPKWQSLLPGPGRQRLLAALRKQDDEGFPIFVSKVRGVKVWDHDISRDVSVPVIDDDIRARMAYYEGLNADRLAEGRRRLESHRRDVEAGKRDAQAASVAHDSAKQSSQLAQQKKGGAS